MLAACLSGVALLGTWGSTQQAPLPKPTSCPKPTAERSNAIRSRVHLIWLDKGYAPLLSAWLGNKLGRRPTYCTMRLALASVYLLFLGNTQYGPMLLVKA
ncbi:MAG: hypothetical protein U0930_19595 [Pirellulales bacterium]